MKTLNGFLGKFAKCRVEKDLPPTLARGMKNGPALDVNAEHFFETQRLGAKLCVIIFELSSFALLVLNGAERKNFIVVEIMFNLDDIALSGDAEPFRKDRQTPPKHDPFGDFVTCKIGVFMYNVAGNRVAVGFAPPFEFF
jgi:hypothetical protein